jgi:type II secretory pathway component PulF
MVTNGFPVNESLVSLARCGDKTTRKLASSLHMKTIEGENLAEAFHSCRKMLGGDYSGYVAVGIKSGDVGEILIRLGDNIKKTIESGKKVKSALTYPVVMAIVTLVISLFLFTQTVPMISDSLVDMVGDAAMPKMTLIIMAISQFLVKYGIFLLVIAVVLAAAAIYLFRGPMKPLLHMFITRIPIMGRIVINKNMSLFFRSIAIAVTSGMPVIDGFELASNNISNLWIKRSLKKVQKLIEEQGQPMSEAFESCPYINGIEIPALATGEKSGEIGTMSNMCAETLETQNDILIRRFTALINPILLAIIGAIVGCIMFAVYGPVFAVMGSLS